MSALDVLSLLLNKESTKENQPRRSPWEPPGIAALQSGWGERYKSLFCIARRKANTSGRYGKQEVFAEIGREEQSENFYKSGLRDI